MRNLSVAWGDWCCQGLGDVVLVCEAWTPNFRFVAGHDVPPLLHWFGTCIIISFHSRTHRPTLVFYVVHVITYVIYLM